MKDSQIRGLKEELVHQDDLVAKLQKEKRQLADSRQKTEEDLQVNRDLIDARIPLLSTTNPTPTLAGRRGQSQPLE